MASGNILNYENMDSTNPRRLRETEHEVGSWDAVAARNGLWDTLRCRPYRAAAVERENTTSRAATVFYRI